MSGMSSQMARAVRDKGVALQSGDPERIQTASKTVGLIKITEFVEKTLANMDPLTDAECAQVAALLRSSSKAATAA